MPITASVTAKNNALNGLKTGATHISLHSANPGDTGANELTGNGYARAAGTLANSTANLLTNSADIPFAAASGGNWATATHYACWDSVSGGDFLFAGELTTPKTVTDGETFTFPAGEIDLNI